MDALLAFDTATDRTSIALALGERTWMHEGEGGAKASTTLIPSILGVLAEAGIGLDDLDAIAFGRGPGAFTGLRTACSVAQGLAYGAGKPVLPIDTLMAVAEDARAGREGFEVWVVSDARLGEVYAGRYRHAQGRWQVLEAPLLSTPEALVARWCEAPPEAVAGSALAEFGDRLVTGSAQRCAGAWPRASALLPLARAAWHDGAALDAALALPLYLRDKVALTTAERDAAREAKRVAGEVVR